MDIAILLVVGIAVLVLIVFWLPHRRQVHRSAVHDRAVSEFQAQPGLADTFLAAANATGKPRGLRWIRCDFHGQPLFATNSATGEINALIGAAIGFEAIPGGDMEEVEAVGDIRFVTAVFVYRNGEWKSDGRAIFNLEPQQALERFSLGDPGQ